MQRMATTSPPRKPAVAGQFYPDDPRKLEAAVRQLIDDGRPRLPAGFDGSKLRALIAPHAGYVYSGPIAGSAYAATRPDRFNRVVLFGPAHRVGFEGVATVTHRAFAGPLGDMAVDHAALEELEELPFVQPFDPAHAPEHSLEVHLPFVQLALGRDVTLVPLLFCRTTAPQAAQVLEPFAADGRTLIVISSDLSHFLSYDEAKRADRATLDAVLANRCDGLTPRDACGSTAVQGLSLVAQRHGWRPTLLDLRNSADTAGPRDAVVGYAAVVYEK